MEILVTIIVGVIVLVILPAITMQRKSNREGRVTLEELTAKGWELIADRVKLLESCGACGFACAVIIPGGSIVLESEDANNPKAKDHMTGKARILARELNAEAVLVCGDSFIAELPSADKSLIETIRTIGVSKAIELDLVVRREAIVCKVTTRGGEHKLLQQFYEREGGTDEGAIRLTEAKSNWTPDHFEGRMAEFFS
jgi:hypothetical protein